jgi:NADPH:quinone reductase
MIELEEKADAIVVPKTMRAAAIDRFGDPSVLTLHELPVPELDSGEILIAVHTAGVGSWDADIRGGWSPGGEIRFPYVLGYDGSGLVAATGPDVDRFSPGDAVYAYSWANPKGGFYAEYAAVPADKAASIPAQLGLRQAGAVPTIGLTALQGIDDALHVTPGQSVVVHGASGGVGHLALQFAKLRGARVLATATGTDGKAFVSDLGADMAVDGRQEDVAAAAERFAPDGVDAVLGLVGGKSLDRLVDCVRRGGRVAHPHGVEPEPKKRPDIEIVGYDGIAGPAQFEALARAIEAAKLKVAIAAEYPLEEASKAHERLAQGHILGKLVLRVR